jgi:hypothetical protein
MRHHAITHGMSTSKTVKKEKQEKQFEETEEDKNEVYQPGRDEEMSSDGENEEEQIEVDEE